MKKIKETGFKNYDKVVFSWELTDECQYRCSYCYVKDILKKKIHQSDVNLYKNVLKQLSFKTVPNFRMEMLGGEPTTHPHFLEILDNLEANNKCEYLSVNTNFAKPLSFFSQFSDSKYKKLEFSISVHIEYVERRVDKFLEKIKEFSEMDNIRCFVNINLHKDEKHLPTYSKIVNFLTANEISTGVNYLFSTQYYNSVYTQNFHDTMISNVTKPDTVDLDDGLYVDYEKYPYVFEDGTSTEYDLHEINKLGLKSFKGYNCRPKLWYINMQGVFTNACTGETIDLLFKNVDKCVTCPCDICACDFMLNYHKTAPGEPLPVK